MTDGLTHIGKTVILAGAIISGSSESAAVSNLHVTSTHYICNLNFTNYKPTTSVKRDDFFSLEKLLNNKRKLYSFLEYESNWDGYNAKMFDKNTIERTINIISELTIQPKVFPTPRGTIQIEKDFSDDFFYEIEINNDTAEAYIVDIDRNIEIEREYDSDMIASFINNFTLNAK